MWHGELWYAVDGMAPDKASATHSRTDMAAGAGAEAGHVITGARKLTIDATVGAVRPAAHLGGTVDHGVLDDEGVDVKALGVGVGLGVLQQPLDEGACLDRPPTLCAKLPLLDLRVPADIAVVAVDADARRKEVLESARWHGNPRFPRSKSQQKIHRMHATRHRSAGNAGGQGSVG